MKNILPKFKINFSIFNSPHMNDVKFMRVEILGPYVRINKNLSSAQIDSIDSIKNDRESLNLFIKNEFYKNGLSDKAIDEADLVFDRAPVQ